MTGRRELVAAALFLAACGDSGTSAVARMEDANGAPAVRSHAATGSSVARLEAVHGEVVVQVAGETRWVAARAGDALSAGDAVQAMPGGSATLRLDASGARVDVADGTTLRMAARDVGVRPLTGRIVARSATPVDVVLPPGTLHLAPEGTPPAEAIVEVRDDGSSVEMTRGEAVLARPQHAPLALHEQHFARFDTNGEVREDGALGPVAVALSPEDGAAVDARVVVLRWAALDGATSYRVTLEGADAVRSADVDVPSFSATLVPGAFRWRVAGVHEGVAWPSSEPRTLTVVPDRTPPPLVLIRPEPDAVTHGASVRVEGHTEPLATVEALGVHGRADAAGHFVLEPHVEPGLTNLVVRASDTAGNVRVATRTVVSE